MLQTMKYMLQNMKNKSLMKLITVARSKKDLNIVERKQQEGRLKLSRKQTARR